MSDGGESASLRERVERVIELIRPAIKADGGDIELVEVSDDGTVTIRFLGACIGCPSSPVTLRVGIEQNLKANVDGVRQVVAIE